MLIFRPLFDPSSSTWSYLLGDRGSGEAVLIDPVFEQLRRDETLIRELGLQLKWTLETHVHADHVTGAWLLRQRLGSRIALSVDGGASGADRLLRHGEHVAFGSRHLQVRATPGHTNGCLSYVLDDESRVFTGDCLLIRGCGRTDFQQGSTASLYRSVHMQLFTLARRLPGVPGPRLQRHGRQQHRRGAALQPAPGRRRRRSRFRRLHAAPGPAAPEEDGPGGARQPALRPARRRRPDASRSELGAPELQHRRAVGDHAACAGRSGRQGAGARRARAGGVCPWTGPHRRRAACAAGPTRRPPGASCRAIGRSSPSAARAHARRAPPPCWPRPALPRWPTCAAACCAGAPRVARSWKRENSCRSLRVGAVQRSIRVLGPPVAAAMAATPDRAPWPSSD